MKLKNSALQELYDTVVASTITISPYEASPIDKVFKECDEKLSESITFAHIKDLEDRNDILEGSNKALLEANFELASKKRKIEKEIEELKKQNENLASQYQKLTIENKRLQDANTTLEKASDDRTNLQEVCDKLSGENRRLKFETDLLSKEIDRYRIRYKEQSDKIRELDSARDTSYEQGQKDLWNMLQNVNDATSSELLGCFADVFEGEDLITLDLENFMDEYKKWQEKKKEADHMQDYLERFCLGRRCYNCPLHTGKFMCGRGKWFTDMTSEDLKKYYEKARALSKPVCNWECTLEGTINVEINKDLLNKIYGIDSDD